MKDGLMVLHLCCMSNSIALLLCCPALRCAVLRCAVLCCAMLALCCLSNTMHSCCGIYANRLGSTSCSVCWQSMCAWLAQLAPPAHHTVHCLLPVSTTGWFDACSLLDFVPSPAAVHTIQYCTVMKQPICFRLYIYGLGCLGTKLLQSFEQADTFCVVPTHSNLSAVCQCLVHFKPGCRPMRYREVLTWGYHAGIQALQKHMMVFSAVLWIMGC